MFRLELRVADDYLPGILFSYLLVARQIARGEKNIGSFVAFTSYGYRLLSKGALCAIYTP